MEKLPDFSDNYVLLTNDSGINFTNYVSSTTSDGSHENNSVVLNNYFLNADANNNVLNVQPQQDLPSFGSLLEDLPFQVSSYGGIEQNNVWHLNSSPMFLNFRTIVDMKNQANQNDNVEVYTDTSENCTNHLDPFAADSSSVYDDIIQSFSQYSLKNTETNDCAINIANEANSVQNTVQQIINPDIILPTIIFTDQVYQEIDDYINAPHSSAVDHLIDTTIEFVNNNTKLLTQSIQIMDSTDCGQQSNEHQKPMNINSQHILDQDHPELIVNEATITKKDVFHKKKVGYPIPSIQFKRSLSHGQIKSRKKPKVSSTDSCSVTIPDTKQKPSKIPIKKLDKRKQENDKSDVKLLNKSEIRTTSTSCQTDFSSFSKSFKNILRKPIHFYRSKNYSENKLSQSEKPIESTKSYRISKRPNQYKVQEKVIESTVTQKDMDNKPLKLRLRSQTEKKTK